MFVDEVTIRARAGRGGRGVVAWLHEKGKEYGGPAGGDGGAGGSVYARAVRDVGALTRYRFEKEFQAERGGDGQGRNRHGGNGADLELSFPVGSIIRNAASGGALELLEDGERVLLLRGGKGGYGNAHFKGSKNIRPRQSTAGALGEEADLEIELRLIADAGLVGLPNAGKSSLLNALTNARAKVGAYAFTTLEPNLGDMHGFILADIPGLIEGASEGRGLGDLFLRHIERTKMLLHCISLEHAGDLSAAYRTIRGELLRFDPALAKKKEFIVLTKADLAGAAEAKRAVAAMKKISGASVAAVSAEDGSSIKELSDTLVKTLRAL